MDRVSLIDDYIDYNDEKKSELDKSEADLEALKFRVEGSKTKNELKKEFDKFLYDNKVTGKEKEDLTKIVEDSNDVNKAVDELEEYLKQQVSENQEEYNKSNEDVTEIKQDVVDRVTEDLENVGIVLTGDETKVLDSINGLDDVNKIRENAQAAIDYYDDFNKDKSTSEDDIEVSVDVLSDSLNKPGDQTILNEAKENDNKDNTSSIVDNGDGTIVINGDASNSDSMNYTAMVTSMLSSPVANNDLSMNLNLDMIIKKDANDTSKYKVVFGNLPVSKMTDDKRLSPVMINAIEEKAKEYDPNRDYMDNLATVSPEISTAFEIIDNNLLNREGYFQFALKNGGKEHDMRFHLSPDYNDIFEAFNHSGANTTYDMKENGVVDVNNKVAGEQLIILDSTNKELKQNQLDNTQALLTNGKGLVKEMKSVMNNSNLNNAALVNPLFLTFVVVTEALLLGFFLFMIFTG